MKENMNKLKNIIAVAVCVLGLSACGDSFLEEKLTTQLSTEYFDTPEGLKGMAIGLPQALRIQGTYEFSYAMNNYGTDEFTVGSDAAGEPWNNYDARLQSVVTSSSNTVHPVATWDPLYTSISTQNIVIAKAPDVLANDSELNDIMGAAYFMRAWSYFYLVQQWGGVPLLTAPVEGLQREFTRASRQEVVQQIIDDFQRAYDLLNNPALDARVQGKIYKDAAAHFLAKALLYRQSEICSDFSAATASEDLSKALTLCEEVIAHRPLAANFADLQNYTAPNGPSEQLPENILAAQYTYSTAGANGRFNKQMCLHYISIYQNWTGMERDIAGGREYARLRTTDYAMDVYDRVDDSRFWKSYRTMQRLNYPPDRNGADFQNINLEIGQVGVMFIINDEADADRFEAQTGNGTDALSIIYPGSTAGRQPPLVTMDNGSGNWDTIRCPVTSNVVPNVIPRYRKVRNMPSASRYGYATVENAGLPTPGTASTWPTLNKFLDGSRPDYSSDNSSRDFVVARVAETYLIAAEIKVRQGDYAGAIAYINKVRERAGYKAGEDREKYVDGAQIYDNTTDARRSTSFWGKNTYYISNNIPVTTLATNITIDSWNSLPPEDEAIIARLGYSSDFDRMMCLVLNERTRELAGEMIRWTDLARTKTLIKRTLTFNEDAIYSAAGGGGLREHHLVRPIPQEFLDQLWANGHALTAEEKQAFQNPGYN
jgi:hypothetical protein